MKRLFYTFLLAVVGLCPCVQAQAQKQVLFATHEHDTIPYRIPAIAQTHNGNLLYLTDWRPCGSDIGYGRVDQRYRVSADGGRTWGRELTLVEGSGRMGAADCGFGDPALVADRKSGEVLLLTVCGSTVYGHKTTTRQNPNRIALFRSFDNGLTWQPWQEVTEQIYSLFDASAHGPVQSMFIGSGKIAQSRKVKVGKYYRIYAAACARPNGNRVIYSDDFGRSWHALGGKDALPCKEGDEPKCEELPDGSVVLSSRAMGGRYFNIYRYTNVRSGEGSWQEAAFSGKEVDGVTAVENSCNGELLIVKAREAHTGRKVNLALQSVPLGPRRSNVGIYYKVLRGEDCTSPASLASHWEKPFLVSPLGSAYSTMVQLKDGSIAFAYEEDTYNAAYSEVFRRLTIAQITNGKYNSK